MQANIITHNFGGMFRKLLGIVLIKQIEKGDFMSHSTNARKNKGLTHEKVFYRQYLYDAGEPRDVRSHDTPIEFEEELLENSYGMRKKFRGIAKKMREFTP